MLELESVDLLENYLVNDDYFEMINECIRENVIIVNIHEPSMEYLLKQKYNIDIEYTESNKLGFGNDIIIEKNINSRFVYRCFRCLYLNFITINDNVNLSELYKDFIKCGYIIEKKLISLDFYNKDLHQYRNKYFLKTVIQKNVNR